MRTTAFALALILVVAMVEFIYGAQTVQLVVYARQSLGLGSGGYGVLLTAAGAGGLVSALVKGRLATGRRVSLIVIVAGSLACATELAYAGVQVLAIALAVMVIGNAKPGLLPGGRRDSTGADRPPRGARAGGRDLFRSVEGRDHRWRGPGVGSRGVHIVASQADGPVLPPPGGRH